MLATIEETSPTVKRSDKQD